MEVISIIGKKIYGNLPFAVLFAFLFLSFYLFQKEHGFGKSVEIWFNRFLKEKKFRGTFYLAFYAVLVLYRTVLGRAYRKDTFQAVFSGWGFFSDVSKDATDAAQNVVLLLPFVFLLYYFHADRIWKDGKYISLLKQSIKITFLFSLGIETTQGVLGFGSFQISDLVYNTLGGVLGAVLYFLLIKCKKLCKQLQIKQYNKCK